AVRATDRPQSVAGWRPILGQTASPESSATVALGAAPVPESATVRTAPAAGPLPSQARSPAKNRAPIWIAVAAGVVLAMGGAIYGLIGESKPVAQSVAAAPISAVDKAAQDAQAAAEAQRVKDQAELAKLRAEAAAREKANQEVVLRRQ